MAKYIALGHSVYSSEERNKRILTINIHEIGPRIVCDMTGQDINFFNFSICEKTIEKANIFSILNELVDNIRYSINIEKKDDKINEFKIIKHRLKREYSIIIDIDEDVCIFNVKESFINKIIDELGSMFINTKELQNCFEGDRLNEIPNGLDFKRNPSLNYK